MTNNMAIKIIPSKRLSENNVYDSKYFKVKKVEIEFNGKKLTKEIIYRMPVVYILAINEKNELYLVKQYRDALKEVSTEVIAGTLNENEDPLLAAKRELAEETGITANSWDKIGILNLAANMYYKAHIYLARNLSIGEPNFDADEFIETICLPYSKVIEKIENGEINHSPSIAAILLLNNLLNKNKI